ncbi:serine/threonine protein phosphatase [Rhizobium leguminosarum bv. viciae]|uniref:metallophosphoesterase n=1 Tax=Rhizobium leguminosarum TaxID=384 RepID=UPI0010399B7C|nr:metallophosphoesterase [Rhizobium leguminosarum]TBY27406.1 serine/threonine protein phosphatase [Rhizobium leguminosarum bv. viciae]TCA99432.1 serine/threonine protein phosphatase [Rhizobium leguminosarum bv. viciae]
MKTYAIGDVHGRADLLGEMLEFIAGENIDDPQAYRVVFLGDIIDRGPDSRIAMDLVVAELGRHAQSRLIVGNHEEFLLYFLDLPEKRDLVFGHWMNNGGLACATSYGLDATKPYTDLREAHRDLMDLLDRNSDHVAAIRAAESSVVDGDYILVHAGLRPGVPLGGQTTKDLRTIRAAFLDSDFDFGQVVVHGHTVTASGRPEVYANRIALDTSGGQKDVSLSAVVLEAGRPNRFLAARHGAGRVKVNTIEPLIAGLQEGDAKPRRLAGLVAELPLRPGAKLQ